MRFKNRVDAGKQLSQLLAKYKGNDVVVFALPRGGVVVADEIAKSLHAPLGLIFAHKIGHPYQPEYAIAAVSEGGHIVGSAREMSAVGEAWLEKEKAHQIAEIKRKRLAYLNGKKDLPVEDKVAILVDDGIATGLTMQVGIQELKDRKPKKIVVAVPVAPSSTAALMKTMADEFVGTEIEEGYFLGAVGAYYDDFSQVEDEEVIEILSHQGSLWKN
jgi:putative phosphoribosyl transferase